MMKRMCFLACIFLSFPVFGMPDWEDVQKISADGRMERYQRKVTRTLHPEQAQKKLRCNSSRNEWTQGQWKQQCQMQQVIDTPVTVTTVLRPASNPENLETFTLMEMERTYGACWSSTCRPVSGEDDVEKKEDSCRNLANEKSPTWIHTVEPLAENLNRHLRMKGLKKLFGKK